MRKKRSYGGTRNILLRKTHQQHFTLANKRKKQLQRYKIQRNAISACIANGVDIPAEELWITKIVKSFFGIPLLRCRVNVETAREHWFVFGVIPVFAKKNYD